MLDFKVEGRYILHTCFVNLKGKKPQLPAVCIRTPDPQPFDPCRTSLRSGASDRPGRDPLDPETSPHRPGVKPPGHRAQPPAGRELLAPPGHRAQGPSVAAQLGQDLRKLNGLMAASSSRKAVARLRAGKALVWLKGDRRREGKVHKSLAWNPILHSSFQRFLIGISQVKKVHKRTVWMYVQVAPYATRDSQRDVYSWPCVQNHGVPYSHPVCSRGAPLKTNVRSISLPARWVSRSSGPPTSPGPPPGIHPRRVVLPRKGPAGDAGRVRATDLSSVGAGTEGTKRIESVLGPEVLVNLWL